MDVLLRFDPVTVRRWQLDLAARLEAAGHRVAAAFAPTPAPTVPGLGLVQRVETKLHRLRAEGPGSLVDPARVRPLLDGARGRPDVLVDLGDSDAPPIPAGRVLRPSSDGAPLDVGFTRALVDRRAPRMTVTESGAGAVVADARLAVDDSRCLTSSLHDLFATAAALCATAVKRSSERAAAVLDLAAPSAPPPVVGRALRDAGYQLAKRLVQRLGWMSDWKVAWRRVEGPDTWDLGALDHRAFADLDDGGGRYLADPFPVERDGATHLFVEDFDYRTGRAAISVVPFSDRGPLGPVETVLEEPFHLSYPQVFVSGGETWMIPEMAGGRKIGLYRAARYPDRWSYEADLIADIEASDATHLEHAGRHWLLATVREGGAGSFSDLLHVYSAPKLAGPYAPHPGNPVVTDARHARAAGAIVRREGRLLRPVQDCSNGYGGALVLAEILRLDEGGFEQRVLGRIAPPDSYGPRGVHTLNRAGAIETIDRLALSRRRTGAAGS